MSGSRCPAEPRLICPWLANLDAQIGIAKDDLEHRLFFRRKDAQIKVETLIEQRAAAQEIVKNADCPGQEFRDDRWGQTILCGVLVVNSAMQELEQEFNQRVIPEEE